MPEWMHNRSEHILAKNPSMPKSEAFAIATQQMEAGGHGPKSYGTAHGRHAAKVKYNAPKNDEEKSNPGGLESPKMKHASVGSMLVDILTKIGFNASAYGGQPAQNGPGMKGQSQIPPFVAPPIAVKSAGAGVGAGTSTSQYSGPLSFGPFKQTSQIPPFVAPPIEQAKTAAPATGAMGVAGKLRAAQRVAGPKVTGFAGPSISEVSKPKGFGKPLSGTLKNQL